MLPAIEWGESWEVLIDTRTADQVENRLPAEAGTKYTLLERSMVVMRLRERASYVGGPPVEAAT